MAVVAPQWKKVIFPAAVVAVLCVEGFQSPLHVRRCHYQQEDSRQGEGRVTALLAHGREDEIRLAGRVDRRRALASTAAAFLSLCLGIGGDKGGSALPAWAVGSDQGQDQLTATAASKTILITGCNSGIGFEAARILARQGKTIIMACRTLEKAVEAAERIRAETNTASLIPAECNLASLDSIRTFAKDLKADNLDVACYNAGLSLNQYDAEAQRTDDGFELTVGTNHLGHFYLNHLLLPKIKPTSRIVITASGVHDPNSPGGAQGKTATLGSLEGFIRDGMNFEMVDGGVFNADKAYKVAKVAETPAWGGAALAYMTQVDTRGEYYNSPPGSSKYGDAAFGREFTVYQVSSEAQDDDKAKQLWELSEKLVGISN